MPSTFPARVTFPIRYTGVLYASSLVTKYIPKIIKSIANTSGTPITSFKNTNEKNRLKIEDEENIIMDFRVPNILKAFRKK
ncbi:hypothetical protein NARC_10215 [Candidatus Nitrosocosmicus arcticus]|uniref:Uncharacterized protein n=1 Tax=Candidatus Nitrosocosmicus arcticus TaxID=2035267 RepID=A0A557SYX7_9ARCH|nr:hypothetical protein NARC_10215 [Candidatus Nitrosocosmicus arcticus]